MNTGSKNKMQSPEATKAPEKKPEAWHFAGSGEYVPVSVEATSYEEALQKWEEIRVPVSKPESTSAAPLSLQDKDVVE